MRCCESSGCRRRVGRLSVALCRAAGGADADGRRERFRRERDCWAPIRAQDPSESSSSIKKKKTPKTRQVKRNCRTLHHRNDGKRRLDSTGDVGKSRTIFPPPPLYSSFFFLFCWINRATARKKDEQEGGIAKEVRRSGWKQETRSGTRGRRTNVARYLASK